MSFSQAINSGFRRYVDFRGRSSRSEYWYWVLFYFLISLGFGVLEGITRGVGATAAFTTVKLVDDLVDIAFFLPTIAVAVRRLHDTNRSGWWYLIAFTIIGLIPLIIWFCTRGTLGENPFGPDPLGAEAPQAKPENTFAT